MKITREHLKEIMPNALSNDIEAYLPMLNDVMPVFGINTPLRVCHFLAQIAHESGELRYSQEVASGKAYDTGRLAKILGNTPEADGDGQKYKGRGLIQLTGTANYKRFNEYLKNTLGETVDTLAKPEIVESPKYSVMTACWFFKTAGCLTLSDKDDVKAVTKRINGGYNGLASRTAYLKRAKKVLL